MGSLEEFKEISQNLPQSIKNLLEQLNGKDYYESMDTIEKAAEALLGQGYTADQIEMIRVAAIHEFEIFSTTPEFAEFGERANRIPKSRKR